MQRAFLELVPSLGVRRELNARVGPGGPVPAVALQTRRRWLPGVTGSAPRPGIRLGQCLRAEVPPRASGSVGSVETLRQWRTDMQSWSASTCTGIWTMATAAMCAPWALAFGETPPAAALGQNCREAWLPSRLAWARQKSWWPQPYLVGRSWVRSDEASSWPSRTRRLCRGHASAATGSWRCWTPCCRRAARMAGASAAMLGELSGHGTW